MGRVALCLLSASCIALLGCHDEAAPAAVLKSARVKQASRPRQLPTGLNIGLSNEHEPDSDEVAPWEDPLRHWQQQHAQTLRDWVLSLQSRAVIEFTALDHRQWRDLAPLLEYIPYSYYLLVIGEYSLLGELQALVLYGDEGGRLPFTNVAKFAEPPTTQQLEQLVWPPYRRGGPPVSHLVWVNGKFAASGGPSIERAFTRGSTGPLDAEITMAGDHALISGQLIDTHFRMEASHRLPSLLHKNPLEATWLRLQSGLLAVITVADIDPQLRIELRLHPQQPEHIPTISREIVSLLQTLRQQWSSIDLAAYEQEHDAPTDPLLWELVRNLLHEAQVTVEPSGVVVVHWTAQPALRQRLLDEGPEILKRMHERAAQRQRRRRVAQVAQALEIYLRHHHNTYPTDIYDSQGQPLLSWRVRLLPYLNAPYAQTAYQRLNLEQPWDSPHNAAVLAALPSGIFAANPDTPEGYADIVTVRGPGLGFCVEPGEAPIRTRDFAILQQAAVMVEVSAEAAVPFGKPGDLDWTADDAPSLLGPANHDHFFAILGSGQVGVLPRNQDRATLHALFSRQP